MAENAMVLGAGDGRRFWTFANPGPGQARMLVIGSRPAQAMVEEIGQLSEAGRLTPDSITEVYRRFDSEPATQNRTAGLSVIFPGKMQAREVPSPERSGPRRSMTRTVRRHGETRGHSQPGV